MLAKGNRTIPALLDLAANEFRDYNYLSYKTEKGWTPFTYKEVRDNAHAMAVSLKQIGIQKNDCLAIISEGSPMWVTSEHGIVCAGAISVPLSVKLLAEEIPYRFNHAEVKAVFTSHNHLSKMIQIDEQIDNKDMYIIYMDDDQDYFYEELKKAGIEGSRGLAYNSLLEKGKKELQANPQSLKQTIDDVKEDDVVNISYSKT